MSNSPLGKRGSESRRCAVSADSQSRHVRRQRSHHRRKLFLEQLEDRALMATVVWAGGSGPNWTTPANWIGGAAPQQDDNLVFPATATSFTSVNDFASGTRFRSVTVSGSSYAISGAPVTLLEGLVYNASSGTATFTAPLTLGAAQTIYSANNNTTITLGAVNIANLQTLTIDGRGSINIGGSVAGTGPITKLGDGSLILAGDNAAYDGIITVTQGVLNARHNNALGATTAGTIAGLGAVVQVEGGVTIGENIAIRDVGVGADLATLGALRSIGTGTNVLTGTISLFNHGSVGVDAGGTLRLTGQVMVPPGTSDGGLTKFGAGTLELAGTESNVITGQTTVLQGTLLLNKAAGKTPFSSGLVIGDNRDGVANPATVRLLANDQLPETNFFGTNVNAITVLGNGTLDFNGFDDAISNLILQQSRSDAADVVLGGGTLTLLGDLTLSAGFQGSSGTSPAATIAGGNLDLGSFFSGVGGVSSHTFTVNDTALPNVAADLIISANLVGGSPDGVVGVWSKLGTGTLRLAGTASTYSGATRLVAGITEIGSNAAFGNSSLMAISGGSIAAQGGNRTVNRPVSVDGSFNVLGDSNITFTSTAQTLLTGAGRTITILDPAQVTTFQSGFTEGLFAGVGAGLTKAGQGELNIAGPSTFAGALTIGSLTTDGGTVRFSGNGSLTNNLSTITVQNGSLILDNSSTSLSDRLTDAAPITLTQGRLEFIGNSAGSSETVGAVTITASTRSVIESETTGLAGTNRLNLWSLNTAATTQLELIGGNKPLSEAGDNQINLLQAGPVLANNVLPTAIVTGPGGTVDLATIAGGQNGLALIPLPAEGYVNSFDAANPTSHVKLTTPGTYSIDSRTVNSLIVGPGVLLTGNGPVTTLTVTGSLALENGAVISVPYLQTSSVNQNLFVEAGGTGTVSGILTRITNATALAKFGSGTLALSGANQFDGSLTVNQGAVAISHSSALGSPAAGTTVNYSGELRLSGGITVLGEAITATGIGADGLGAIKNTGGNNQLTGAVTLNPINTYDSGRNFPNNLASLTGFNAGGIDVAAGSSLNISGVLSGTTDLIKTGGGTLELSGVNPNLISTAPRIKQGTLLLNKVAGVTAIAAAGTWTIGDDVSGSATVRLGADNQILDTAALQLASNGTLDLDGNDEIFTTLAMEIGPLGGSVFNIGAGGSALISSNTAWVTVHTLGGANPTGASITGGTLGLQLFNSTTGAVAKAAVINDSAAAVDLLIDSAIVDGTGFQAAGITKTGFGTLQFSGTTPNTFTGTTTVNEGTLQLNKTAGVNALSGPLTVGDGSLQSGGIGSDAIVWLQSNQLPDYNAAVVVGGTGLLNLNGRSETIGTADGVTALTVTSGLVQTGAGTLTVNGNISTAAGFTVGTLPATNTAVSAPEISGNLAIGDSFLRIMDAGDRGELLIDAIISANISGAAEVRKQGNGNLLLAGNNSGLTGNFFFDNNPGFNQATLTVGSDTALGTGIVYPASTVRVAADGGPRTIGNWFQSFDLLLVGGNNLRVTGAFDLMGSATLTVSHPVTLELAGGVGEMVAGANLNKSGSGTLSVSAPALHSGSTTINAAGGEILLSGGGTLANVSSIVVNIGGTLSIDNLSSVNMDRVRNPAGITLAGGGIELVGGASAVNEIVGTLTTNSNFTSLVTSNSQGAATKLSFNALTRNANSFLLFNGMSPATANDLGSANNQVVFYSPPTNLLLNGILPFAALRTRDAAGNFDIEFAGYDALVGISSVTAITSLAGATAKDNVKLSASATVTNPTAVNALLLVGNGSTLSGAAAIQVASGLVLNYGANNTLSTPLHFGGQTAVVMTPIANQNLTLGGMVSGDAGLVKAGPGALQLSGNNTYAGTTSINEGTLRITHSNALGIASNSNANYGTTVLNGAALEIDGSGGAVNVGDEALTLNGLGMGYGNTNALVSGNRGALRNIAGTNSWTGAITLTNAGINSTVVLGVDAGELKLNAAIGQTANVNVTKVGPGLMEFGGSTANTYTGGTTTIAEGTLRLNKPAGVAAIGGTQTVQVGDNVGGAGADQIIYLANDQVSVTNTINVQSSGRLNLNGSNETVNGTLTLINGLSSAAEVATGTGTLTINNNAYVTVDRQANTFGGLTAPLVTGNLALQVAAGPAATRTLALTNESIGDVDLEIAATISDGDGNANLQNVSTAGAGRLLLSGANNFSGVFTVGGGRTQITNDNALGASGAGAGTVVNSGFTLELNNVTVTDESLTLNGVGFGSRGALLAVPNSGTSTWLGTTGTTGVVTLTGIATNIGVDNSALLNLNTVVAGNFAAVAIQKLLPGTLRFSGANANTFTGTGSFRVIEGVLELGKNAGVDAVGVGVNLAAGVGNDVGGQDADVIRWLQDEQLPTGATLQIVSSGLADLNGKTETLQSSAVNGVVVTLNYAVGARARIANGTLILGGANDFSNVAISTGTGSANMVANTPGAVIEANLNLGGGRRQFNVTDNPANPALMEGEISGVISNGQLDKRTGAGTLLLSNNLNSYTGFDAVQTFGVTVDGAFTMTFRGVVTPTFNSTGDATGAALQTFLNNNLFGGATNVLVTRPGGANTPYTITFTGDLAKRGMPLFTATAAGATLTQPTETVIGGGTVLNTIAGITTGANAIAVGGNGALGAGGLNVRGNVANGLASIRTNTSSLVLPNAVDLTTGAGSGFQVFTAVAQRVMPDTTQTTPTVTFNNTIANHYTVAGPFHIINVGSSFDPSQPASSSNPAPTVILSGAASTPVANVALDLGNQPLNFRNYSNQITSIPGNIVDSAGAVAGTLVKQFINAVDGTGTLILSGNNTYDGTTTIGGGVLRVTSSTALGTKTDTVQTFGVTGVTGNSFTITFNGQVTAPLAYTAGDIPPSAAAVQAALNGLPAMNALGGPISVTSSNPAGPATTYTLTFSGALSGFNQAVVGVTVTGATVSPAPAITTAGGGGTTVSANAALEIQGHLLTIDEPLTISGLGLNGIPTGAIRTRDGAAGAEANTLTGTIAMAANSVIAVDGSTDSLAQGDTSFLSGAFSLTKFGAGTLELGGTSNNNYTGGTFVNQGVLLLNKSDTAGRFFQPTATGTGGVTVGDEMGGADSDVLRYGSSAGVDQIYGLVNVTVAGSGLFDLATNSKSDFINGLTLNASRLAAGDVQTGAGALTVNGDVTVNPSASVYSILSPTSPAASISGNLQMTGATQNTNQTGAFNQPQTFFVNSNATLNVSAEISDLPAVGGFFPGLREGNVAGLNSLAANPNTGFNVYPRMAETFSSGAGNPWGSTTTWVYTGQFYDADGVVSFASAIDDGSRLTIDGVEVLFAPANTTLSTGVLTLGAGVGGGWHTFEYRASNGTGNGGAALRNNFNNLFGFGIAPNGAGTSDGLSYAYPIDNGSQNLFRSTAATPYSLVKAGRGTLNITTPATYTGSTTIAAQGGQLILSGNGALANTSGIVINQEGTLKVDNSTINSNTRINDAASMNLTGGLLWYVGNSATWDPLESTCRHASLSIL